MTSRAAAIGAVGLLLLTTACSSIPGIQSARKGDFASLKKTLERENLNPRQVRRIAQEVLSAEIVRAKDREDRPFISGLRGCARPLYNALEDRAQTRDGVGAEAALLLLEGGRLHGATGKFRHEKDGAWRALSARASKGNPTLRRGYFTDDDERVRRAALLAALEAADESDIADLLEVARLDPDPLTRNRAYQTLGRIGGDRISLALKDRFQAADEELRLAIVDAWAQPAIYQAGGRQQLLRLVTHKSGFDALHAARVLSKEKDETLRNQGLARLIRFVDEGTTQERRMALRFLPARVPITEKKLLELTKTEDQEVAVIAWARLLGSASHNRKAEAALMKWAQSEHAVAFQARSALAAAGSDNVLPLMKKQVKAKAPETRRVAGNALVRLGALPDMAPLLADEDPNVRRAIACKTLARPPLPAQ